MELHTLDGELAVAEAHDDARAISIAGPGADFEIGRQALFGDDERVIASCGQRGGNSAKNGLAVVFDQAGLAVHQCFCAYDVAAKSRADGLMTEADSEQGNFAGEMANQIDADAGVLGRAGTGRNQDTIGVERSDLADREFIVTAYLDLGAELPQILDEVVGERVVVVEDEYHEVILRPSDEGRGSRAANEAEKSVTGVVVRRQ